MPVQHRYSAFVQDQRRFFDELITEDWETYKSSDWDYARTFEIRQFFKRVQPATILDVGCGCGFHDQVMAEYPFVQRVDAIDYSEQSIRRAEVEYAHPKIHRAVADFALFQPEREYDLVISFQVIEHLANPKVYFDFCARACKPQGIVAVCTPNRLRWDNRIRLLRRQPLALIDVMHYREYTMREVIELGKPFGLEPAGWFGHTLQSSASFGRGWRRKLSYQHLTQLGYLFPHVANVIGVIMRKGNGFSK